MLNIAAIASGSNGNCYLVEDEKDAVLVDAGISCKQVLERMESLSLDVRKVKGILVTHEHIDHVRGVQTLSSRLSIPVHITRKTLGCTPMRLGDDLVRNFEIGKEFTLSGFSVMPFHKQHDAIEPCSFTLSKKGKRVCIMTDMGRKCRDSIRHISDCDAVFLESNYDEEMLESGPYPTYLKKRISSDTGHLSNYQAGLFALEHASKRLSCVFLSHLSQNNNTPELAMSTFCGMVRERKDLKCRVIMTSRHKESQLVALV